MCKDGNKMTTKKLETQSFPFLIRRIKEKHQILRTDELEP